MDKLQKLIDAMNEKVQKAQKDLDEIRKMRATLDPDEDNRQEYWYCELGDRAIEAQLKVNSSLSELEWILSVIARSASSQPGTWQVSGCFSGASAVYFQRCQENICESLLTPRTGSTITKVDVFLRLKKYSTGKALKWSTSNLSDPSQMAYFIPELNVFMLSGSASKHLIGAACEVMAKPQQLDRYDAPEEVIVLRTEYESIANRQIALINAESFIPVLKKKPNSRDTYKRVPTRFSKKRLLGISGSACVVQVADGYEVYGDIWLSELCLAKTVKLLDTAFASVAKLHVALFNSEDACLPAPPKRRAIRKTSKEKRTLPPPGLNPEIDALIDTLFQIIQPPNQVN